MPAAGARRALFKLMSTVPIALLAGGSAVMVVAAACGPAEPESRLSVDADTYVVVMSELADLERFPPPGSDEMTRGARADSARVAILERHGVTVEELLEFAETVGEDPHRMVELVERIVVITDSLANERTGGRLVPDTAAAAAPGSGALSDSDLATGAAADEARPDATFPDFDAALDEFPADEPAADEAAAAAANDTLPMRDRLRNLRERRDAERTPAP